MKLFVWDFHGVLEKDNEKAVIDISNRILAAAGFKERFTAADNERYYGLKWYQYFERLLPSLPPDKHLELQAACFQYSKDNPDIIPKHIKLNDHADEVLAAVRATRHQQIVISNSRPNDLIWFLDAISLMKYFDPSSIIGVNAHQKHSSKLEALADYLIGKNFERVIVIGDSENDLKLGKAFDAVTYFYKHPHRRHEETTLADHIINDLRDVLLEL